MKAVFAIAFALAIICCTADVSEARQKAGQVNVNINNNPNLGNKNVSVNINNGNHGLGSHTGFNNNFAFVRVNTGIGGHTAAFLPTNAALSFGGAGGYGSGFGGGFGYSYATRQPTVVSGVDQFGNQTFFVLP